MVKKGLPLFLLLLLFASLVLNINFYNRSKLLDKLTLVKDVIDGDTLILSSGQSVRLLGVNAPEINFCGGQEAKKRLTELTLGKNAILSEVFADTYNRMVALVNVDGRLINEIMLREGWGRINRAKNSKGDVLKVAYDLARSENRGIYSFCISYEPPSKDCIIKGNVDTATLHKYYHLPGCTNYDRTVVEKDLGEDWFCTEDEAVAAGFSRALNCAK